MTIDVATASGHVVATIADDGVGGADSRRGSGCVACATGSRHSAAGSGSKAHPEPARRSKPCSRRRSAYARERLDREREEWLAAWNSGERPGISVDVPAEDVGRPGRDPESLLPEDRDDVILNAVGARSHRPRRCQRRALESFHPRTRETSLRRARWLARQKPRLPERARLALAPPPICRLAQTPPRSSPAQRHRSSAPQRSVSAPCLAHRGAPAIAASIGASPGVAQGTAPTALPEAMRRMLPPMTASAAPDWKRPFARHNDVGAGRGPPLPFPRSAMPTRLAARARRGTASGACRAPRRG